MIQFTRLKRDQCHLAESEKPKLPPELWLKIFAYAMRLPGAFSHTDVDSFVAFTRDHHGICAQNRFKAVMNTKLSISLVCSAWNTLAMKHLFEYLLIESGSQVLGLADAFTKYSAQSDYGVHHPGWWTTRLEIALDGVHAWDMTHTQALAYVIRKCPNLVCFSTAFCTADPKVFYSPAVINSLAEYTDVKRVELRTDLPLLKSTLMALSDSLEMIWLLPSRGVCDDEDRWSCCLPKLHTFISHLQFGRAMDHLELPALKTLVVNDPCDRTSTISKTGSCLQYLSISDIRTTVPLLPTCQSLETLAINFHEVTLGNFALLFKNMTLSNVQRLIIEGHSDVDLSWWFSARPAMYDECLRKNLLSFASAATFPKLQRIQLVLPLSFEAICGNPSAKCRWHSTWSSWFIACTQRGITVEMAYGSEQWSVNEWQPLSITLD
ncbi:hypothetical protein AMATHDRAFT_141830 [Amanita thiersii Skay4041]|uniref:F-box domain-containing protein n=1 Tax=Amanita thiersii Skay4041 TaxID=703135 RepID=A0A2A9NVM4_9AGAR|nr:hypothetical protein AMATHDRAFT_141830 [Amanita thiersii Skay4041]